MGEHVDALAWFLFRSDRLDQGKAMPADTLVDRDVFLGNLVRARIGCRGPVPRAAKAATSSAFRRAPISG
jgi:hypothetical protein